MIRNILIALFCLSTIISCNKVKYGDNGLITGPNIKMCPTKCCGGVYIVINNTTYLFETLPANAGIDLKPSSYPISVSLNWKPITGCSSPQTIQILDIKKR